MSGFFQILGGGIVGMAAVLAAQYVPALMAPDEPAVVAAPVEVWPAGTMVLAQTADGCAAGWVSGGAVTLGSPAPLGSVAGDTASGAVLPATVQTFAFLCIKAAP